MSDKLRLWNNYSNWDQAEKAWDEEAARHSENHPLKILKQLPSMPGIAKETARGLKWKSLRYLLKHDHAKVIPRYYFKRPLKYTFSLLKSLIKKKPFQRDGDFFLYGVATIQAFKKLIEKPNSLLVAGFSYCHKPHECPSGRFTTECVHQPEHPVCRQCFIGKAVNALPEKNTIVLFITTIHYIGEKIFEIVNAYPDQEVHFLITACEMTLQMFGDWGNMVDIKGIGVRLDGRICNTMKAFELSENGIKPGLTVVLDKTQKEMLELIKHRRNQAAN